MCFTASSLSVYAKTYIFSTVERGSDLPLTREEGLSCRAGSHPRGSTMTHLHACVQRRYNVDACTTECQDQLLYCLH